MAINQKGYGDSQGVGFDSVLSRDSEGKPETYFEADKFDPTSECYLEVVSLDLWESNSDDYLKVWLFDPYTGAMTRVFGKITDRTMWKLERTIRGIFGTMLPIEEVQGESGRMPLKTRKAALGRYVKVEIKNGQYDDQDVLIIGNEWYQTPGEVKPMFSFETNKPTGHWPTSAPEFLEKRVGIVSAAGGTPAETAEGEEDW